MARKNTLQLDAKLMKKMQTSKFAVSQNDICGKRYGRQTFGVVKNRNRGTRAEGENNSVIYIAVSVLTVAIIAFVASFIFYGNFICNKK